MELCIVRDQGSTYVTALPCVVFMSKLSGMAAGVPAISFSFLAGFLEPGKTFLFVGQNFDTWLYLAVSLVEK